MKEDSPETSSSASLPPLQATLLSAWKREFAGAVAVKEERGTDFHDSIARTERLHPRLSSSRRERETSE
jgi:hypothetical protein